MGKNEKALLQVAWEIIKLLIERANIGEDITDAELDDVLAKAKEAKDKFKE